MEKYVSNTTSRRNIKNDEENLSEDGDDDDNADSVKSKDTRYVVSKLLKVHNRVKGRAEELEKRINSVFNKLTPEEEFELVTTKYTLV
jgi:hypothetical protein